MTKILVVEDTVDTRELLHLYLTREGYTVIVGSNGGEGLYRAKAESPDLIITDINMPGMDGLSMIKELREEPEFAEKPIIALTAYGKGVEQDAIDAGATETIQKPFDFEKLIAQVRALLSTP